PLVLQHLLYLELFRGALRLPLAEHSGFQLVVFFGGLAGEQGGFAAQTVLHPVEAWGGFSFLCAGSARSACSRGLHVATPYIKCERQADPVLRVQPASLKAA